MNRDHWWIFWAAFMAALLVLLWSLYGCGEFRVGVQPVAQPTTRPIVDIHTGDQAGDPWLSYALVAAVVVVALCSPPPCWLWRRRRRRRL